MNDLTLLIPEFLLTALAFIVLGVDLFLPDRRKQILPAIAVVGPRGHRRGPDVHHARRGRLPLPAADRGRAQPVRRGAGVRRVCAGLQGLLRGARDRRRAVERRVREAPPAAPRRVLRHPALHRAGDDADGVVPRAADGVHLAGAAELRAVRARLLRPLQPEVERGRHEIHPAGRVFVRPDALRHQPGIRVAGHDPLRGDGRAPVDDARPRARRAGRAGAAHSRPGVQGRGCPVPHVGARRLRGRARAHHGVPGGRIEGSGVRADRPALRRRPRARARRPAGRHGRAGRADHGPGQPRGPGADQHQAAAGLLQRRARGVPAAGSRGTVGPRRRGARRAPGAASTATPWW